MCALPSAPPPENIEMYDTNTLGHVALALSMLSWFGLMAFSLGIAVYRMVVARRQYRNREDGT